MGLLDRTDAVKKRAEPFLGRISDNFPEYTIHDVSHSEQVIANLDWLMPDDLKRALNDYEIHFLLVACYLHDIGMFVGPEERKRVLASEEFQDFCEGIKRTSADLSEDELFQDFIREKHHLRSEEFIQTHWGAGEDGLGIEDAHQSLIIARICRGHRKEDLADFDLFKPRVFYRTNIPINVAYLAGMLRLADALDITAERVPLLLYRELRPRKPISLQKWEEHRSVVGIGPDQRKITISASCTEPDIHRALKKAVQQIQDEMAHVRSAIARFPSKLRDRYFFAYASVNLDVQERGYKLLDFKFQLSEYALIQLLMGEKLYERRDVGIRELLQNALDTCRQRQKLEATYEPRICFALSSDGERLVVEDNGMGMNEAQVTRYFIRIGESYYRSSEFLAMDEPKRVDPISQFGIGILSCFLIADRIVVDTKGTEQPALRLEIDNAFDYFVVRDGARRHAGTTIELVLKKDPNTTKIVSHLIDIIRAYARHVEIPIVVRKEDGSEYQVGDGGYSIKVTPSALNQAVRQPVPTLKLFTVSFKAELTEGIEGTVAFPYVTDKSGVPRLHSGSRWDGPRQLSQLGIWIPQPTAPRRRTALGIGPFFIPKPFPWPFDDRHLLPSWLQPNSLFYDLNLSGRHKVNLDVTRDRIVWDEKLIDLRKSLENFLLPDFRRYVRFLFGKLDDWERCLQTARLIRTLVRVPTEWSPGLSYLFHDLLFEFRTPNSRRFFTLSSLPESGIENVLIVRRPTYKEEELYSRLGETCPGDAILFAQNEESWQFLLHFFRLQERKISALLFHPENLVYRVALHQEAPSPPPEWLLGGRAIELVDFEGPGTRCYVARISSNWFLLNRGSAIVQVMMENPQVLDTPERRDFLSQVYFLALEELSRKGLTLRYSEPDLSLEQIQELHRQIIDWYVEAGIIAEHDTSKYQLTARELPWYASDSSEH